VSLTIFARAWSFFDDAMGKAICGIKGALEPAIFHSCIQYIQTLTFFNGLSTLMPFVALLLSEAAVGKQVP
jgi:hypothetical protein